MCICLGVMPYQCNICDKSFLFPYELRKHKKRSHNIEDCPTKVESKSKQKHKEDDDIKENDFAIDKNDSSNIDQENSNDSFEKIKSTKKRKLDEIETGMNNILIIVYFLKLLLYISVIHHLIYKFLLIQPT